MRKKCFAKERIINSVIKGIKGMGSIMGKSPLPWGKSLFLWKLKERPEGQKR